MAIDKLLKSLAIDCDLFIKKMGLAIKGDINLIIRVAIQNFFGARYTRRFSLRV
jgi:hypothetical protein